MAKFYGQDSEYIKSKYTKAKNWLLFLIVVIVITVAALYLSMRNVWYASPLAFLIAVALFKDMFVNIFKDITSSFKQIFRHLGWSDRGLLGERIIKQALEALPDTYSIYRGLQIGHYWDIDFTVVGPNGVFIVETKSQTGKITFDRKGRGWRMIKQAKKEAFGLHQYLSDGWKINTFVVPILALARSGTKINLEATEFNDVHIVKTEQLVTTILNHRGFNPNKDKIEKYLGFFKKEAP